MSKRWRLVRNIAIGLAAFVFVALLATYGIVQTDWFRGYVKQKIIASTEESTGGKVDIGSFNFEPSHLRATVTDFVIHGAEPAGAAPFLRAARIQLDIRLFTSIHHLWDIAYLGIDRPQANVVVFADGRTNVPTPKQKSTSNEPGLQSVVDLAVGHFELTNGLLLFASAKQQLDVRGENLQAQLWFNMLNQGYKGQLAFQPLYVASGRNTPVNFTVTLPVELRGNRVGFENASITTPLSKLLINGSVENLENPKISAHLNGRIALADLKNAADLPINAADKNLSAMDLDANATVADNNIQVTGLRIGLGQSEVEASGTLKNPSNASALEFKSKLVLGELGQLLNLAARPGGTLLLNGTAKLDAANNYAVLGNIEAKALSFTSGSDRISNIDIFSTFHLDPHNQDLKGLRLSAFGGEFAGDVMLQDFERYQVHGGLRNLDLQTVARALGQKQFTYSGVLAGPLEASGDLKSPGVKGLSAQARLNIAPGHKGIPVSGRLQAAYSGKTEDIRIDDSFIALPHTRLTVNGSTKTQLQVAAVTTDLNDLLGATAMTGKPPVVLNGHEARFTGAIVGGLDAPRVTGHLAAAGFSVEDRAFDDLSLDVAASSSGASISNGSLRRGAMQAQFSAQTGLNHWQSTPNQPLSAQAAIRNGDLADVMVLAGQPNSAYSGALTADVHVTGTIGNPRGTATLAATNGTVQGEAFDRIETQVNLADQLITIPSAFIQAGAARVNLSAEFQHPRDSFSTGRIHAHVQSNPVDLAQLRSLQKEHPDSSGSLQLNVDLTGNLSQTKVAGKDETSFLLTAVNGDASARNVRFEGQNYGALNANAHTNAQTVSYDLTSDFAGSNIHVNGNTQLVKDYPSTADASIANLPVERILTVAKRTDIPAKGNLSGKAHFTGTLENPQGNADVDLVKAVLYDEPIDRIHARVVYQAKSIDLQQLEVAAGASRINLTARFDHPEKNLQAGNLQFHLDSANLDLARIQNIQSRRPGLSGVLQMAAQGAAEIRETEPRVKLRQLDANLSAQHVTAQGKNYGDAKLTANTAGGKVTFALDSNLGNAAIQGHGTAELTDGYPVDAQLTFSNVTWSRLQGLLAPQNDSAAAFEAVTDGQVSVKGPVLDPDKLTGSVKLSRLQVSTIPAPNTKAKSVTLQNQGPIEATLDRQTLRLDNVHLTGPQTDIQARGALSLQAQTMDVNVNATANLGLLQNFSRDITSSGSVVLATNIRGSFTNPLLNGRMELKNGSLNYSDIPNGISNANGVIVFNGNSASVQNLTAESGGGKLTAGGFVSFSDGLRFGLQANATNVRVRPQQGVSVVADANLHLIGTTDGGTLSGTATVDRITYAPQTDLGSILTRAGPPVQAASAPSPILDNMKLDIRVRTSDALAVQTSMAQGLSAMADLRIRGTASHPGVLGRVTITEGQLVFFGSTYTVNTGNVAFYNPLRIEPILDINLETVAKGVDVVLRVTGPVDNMKLTYTSDPPLQFQEIVSLLAAGSTPTSDPTILANQPSQPAQNFQQRGESALLSKAVADPVGSRLQRVFGVSQLKIDPSFTSGSELPQAQLTLQQQIANNLTFTYVTALNDPNAQTVRVEFTLNPQWSAVAQRDQNGIFSINFLYKKQLR